MSTYAIGIVSDLHCGSIFGLLPPNFETSAGDTRLLNPGQKYLWECWLKTGEWFKRNKVGGVIVNGDVIDGTQRMQQGTELCLNLVNDQCGAAKSTLGVLKGYTGEIPYYMVQGTEYHDQKAGQAADGVAEALGMVSYSGAGSGKWSKEVLDLDIGGVVLNSAHHISASGGLYRATAADREAVWSALAGKEGKALRADCLIRSHVHYFFHLEHASKHALVTPCFQLQTRFMRKNSVYRMLPDIGATIVWVSPEAKKNGEDPINISKLLFPLPAIRPVKFAA